MPRATYRETLSDLEVLALFDAGRYQCDLEAGAILSKRGRAVHVTLGGNPKRYHYVRLYRGNSAHRMMPVAHVVWIVGNRVALPEGFEVHHRDTDCTNNRYLNLYALFKLDHQKLHDLNLIVNGNHTPF